MPTRRTVQPAAWCLAALPALTFAQTRPTTRPPPTLAELQDKARAEAVKDMAGCLQSPPALLADVVRLGRDGDHLQVLTPVSPDSTLVRHHVPITDLAGLCDVSNTALRVNGAPPASPARMPEAFSFNCYQFDRPGVIEVGTTLTVLPANVQVSRMTETRDGGGAQLQLTELRSATPESLAAAEAVGVRMKYTDAGGEGRPPVPDVEVTADSFGALVRLHPAEVARYLEPVLRDLHADAAVLPPDTSLAYQVFAADVTIDPAVATRVREGVARLDADDFPDRDAAEAGLRSLGPVVAVALERMDTGPLTPEQRARTAGLIRRFHPVAEADAGRLRGDVDFLLNCLNDPDPFVARTALARLRTRTGHDVPFDPSLIGQARRDAVWTLRGRLAALPVPTRP